MPNPTTVTGLVPWLDEWLIKHNGRRIKCFTVETLTFQLWIVVPIGEVIILENVIPSSSKTIPDADLGVQIYLPLNGDMDKQFKELDQRAKEWKRETKK